MSRFDDVREMFMELGVDMTDSFYDVSRATYAM